ncbi:MAG: ABC transporter substrate-binding protein [Thermomicrobiales bacterium]
MVTRFRRTAINRRSFLAGSAALSAAAAVGPRSIRRATAQDCERITVWGVVSFTPEGDELLGQQMVEWGEANGIDVEYVPTAGSDYTIKVATAVEAGTVPDVVMLLGDLTHFYAAQDRLVDLTDVYTEVKDLAGGMFPQLLPHVQVGEQIFSIPMESDLGAMYARLDLIEEVTGAREAPKTLDELEEIALEINDPPQQFGIGLVVARTPDATGNIEQIILAEGGTLVDEAGAPAINSAGTIAALNRIKRWWDAELIPPDSPSWDDAGNNQSYQSGQSAFVFNPASIFAYLEANDPDLLADTTQAPFPAGPAGSFPGVGTWSWSVFNSSACVDQAKELIKAIMQPDKLQAVYEQVGGRWYPVYRDLTQAPWWKERPFFDDFPTIIENARERWFPAEATPTLLNQISACDQKLIVADMLQQVLINDMSPEDAAAEAQTAMEQTFAEAAQA